MAVKSKETSLSGKVILITGSTRGIGRAIALRLSEDGANLIVNGTNEEKLKEVAEAIRKEGRDCLPVIADVSKKTQVDAMFSKAIGKFGKIDVSIHNAGIITVAPFTELKEEEWERVFAVNTKGVFLCCQAVSRQMIKQGYGKIINCASDAARQGFPYEAHYSASKFAIIGLTQSLAKELGSKGITVNAFCPGIIKTDMWTYLDRELGRYEGLRLGEKINRVVQDIPLGRVGDPCEVTGLISFLASDDANYITGQTINVDGGLVMS